MRRFSSRSPGLRCARCPTPPTPESAIKKKPPPQQVRIIGGDYRRTPLAVLDAPGLRPTPDRVRETLFNWLAHLWDQDFAGRRVLDLFAGTGALGLEAASRGVAHATLVESHAAAVQSLRATVARLKAPHVEVIQADALAYLGTAPGGWDLVLLDPPFSQDWLGRLWPRLPALLVPGSLIYVEDEHPVEPPADFVVLRAARAGAVHYHVLQYRPGGSQTHT